MLSSTKKYITSLKSQVEELNKRINILEAAQSGREAPINQDDGGFSSERLTVRIRNVGESTSESRVVDVELNARGNSILVDLVVRVLEFVKQVANATVISVDADTRMLETEVFANRVFLRLRIQVCFSLQCK